MHIVWKFLKNQESFHDSRLDSILRIYDAMALSLFQAASTRRLRYRTAHADFDENHGICRHDDVSVLVEA